MVTSELVTNAVTATRRVAWAELPPRCGCGCSAAPGPAGPGRSSSWCGMPWPRPPLRVRPVKDDESGRGLAIVDCLSGQQWGGLPTGRATWWEGHPGVVLTARGAISRLVTPARPGPTRGTHPAPYLPAAPLPASSCSTRPEEQKGNGMTDMQCTCGFTEAAGADETIGDHLLEVFAPDDGRDPTGWCTWKGRWAFSVCAGPAAPPQNSMPISWRCSPRPIPLAGTASSTSG